MPWDASKPNVGFSDAKPWLPIPAEHVAHAASIQERDADSPLKFAQHLLRWRKQYPQLLQGDIVFFDAPEPVLAFRRELAGHRTMFAAFNLGSESVRFEWPDASSAESLNGHGLPGIAQGAGVELPPYGAWFGLAAN
jgi:alpha-glucosidase